MAFILHWDGTKVSNELMKREHLEPALTGGSYVLGCWLGSSGRWVSSADGCASFAPLAASRFPLQTWA